MDKATIQTAVEWGLLATLLRKSFCFTGTLSMKRADLEEIVNAMGGDIHSSVRQSTTYLVVPNGVFRKGSKYRSAVANGRTLLLSESDFAAMLVPPVIKDGLDQG